MARYPVKMPSRISSQDKERLLKAGLRSSGPLASNELNDVVALPRGESASSSPRDLRRRDSKRLGRDGGRIPTYTSLADRPRKIFRGFDVSREHITWTTQYLASTVTYYLQLSTEGGVTPTFAAETAVFFNFCSTMFE